MSVVNEWLALASQWPVVRRGLGYALVVGSILICINHSDVLLEGSIPGDRLMRMGLTVVVPYLVSTFSSVGAMRQMAKA
ncbi:MAG: nitrate/nitrite transporter NrtS [Planctomycetota bacterium]|nr:nitrate/nitrite transporter NrtS [Planctomycetota bacterium]